jgi:hypothetical protein
VTYNGLYSNFFKDIEAINSMTDVKLISSSKKLSKASKMKERKTPKLNPKGSGKNKQ